MTEEVVNGIRLPNHLALRQRYHDDPAFHAAAKAVQTIAGQISTADLFRATATIELLLGGVRASERVRPGEGLRVDPDADLHLHGMTVIAQADIIDAVRMLGLDAEAVTSLEISASDRTVSVTRKVAGRPLTLVTTIYPWGAPRTRPFDSPREQARPAVPGTLDSDTFAPQEDR